MGKNLSYIVPIVDNILRHGSGRGVQAIVVYPMNALANSHVDFIMDTFPIARRKDEAAHGEYRTKRMILEHYDALAEAIASGTEYEQVLDPPPADPRCAHPESTRPSWA